MQMGIDLMFIVNNNTLWNNSFAELYNKNSLKATSFFYKLIRFV